MPGKRKRSKPTGLPSMNAKERVAYERFKLQCIKEGPAEYYLQEKGVPFGNVLKMLEGIARKNKSKRGEK